MNDGPFIVRQATRDDLRFVCASWFESFWKASLRQTGMEYADYQRGQDALIQRLLERSRTYVLASATVQDEIVGYCVVEGDAPESATAHYVYIKSAYRKFGAAKTLLRGKCAKFSHMTRAGNRVARSLGLQYDPYTLLEETP
jgi:hypothetical protein